MNRRQRRESSRRLRRSLHTFEEKLNAYTNALLDAGVDEREATRAYFYVQRYGFEAITPLDKQLHVMFEEPSCGDWDCVNPEHQRVTFGKVESG